MKGYFYLTTINKENSIIIFGERLCNNEIIFKGKLGFFDALKFSDQLPPLDVKFPYQFIPLTSTSNETIHFLDPILFRKFKFSVENHSLIIIDSDNNLTQGAVFNIFSYFLIKKGNRMLFLTDVPNNKITRRRKAKHIEEKGEQEREL
ncbi:hypothetical protein [Bacillus sp. EB600]|uniref:hypothetical protein n=1 Tax=Bacillus sp. EB600 TaxID=2806345 RepID=UPI00210BE01B|nr:hypothetical protein [Bacillus sp. EB600]MCQ6279247.1 hypothetical protein [Bacillus sp. EB600]